MLSEEERKLLATKFDDEKMAKEVSEMKTTKKERVEIPEGNYEVSLDYMEFKLSKSSNNPMVAMRFVILNGEYINEMIFVNLVVDTPLRIHIANEFMRSMGSPLTIEYKNFTQYDNLVTAVFNAVANKASFELEVSDKPGSNGIVYKRYFIKRVFWNTN